MGDGSMSRNSKAPRESVRTELTTFIRGLVFFLPIFTMAWRLTSTPAMGLSSPSVTIPFPETFGTGMISGTGAGGGLSPGGSIFSPGVCWARGGAAGAGLTFATGSFPGSSGASFVGGWFVAFSSSFSGGFSTGFFSPSRTRGVSLASCVALLFLRGLTSSFPDESAQTSNTRRTTEMMVELVFFCMLSGVPVNFVPGEFRGND